MKYIARKTLAKNSQVKQDDNETHISIAANAHLISGFQWYRLLSSLQWTVYHLHDLFQEASLDSNDLKQRQLRRIVYDPHVVGAYLVARLSDLQSKDKTI